MILEHIVVGAMEVNCYILADGCGSPAIIIDPGAEERKIRKVLDKHNLNPALVINTHGHYDHIGADDKFGVPVYIHKDDAGFLKDPKMNLSGFFSIPYEVKSEVRIINDGDIIEAGGIALKVLHIPGHTPGGIALHMLKPDTGLVFSGDNLFCAGIGRSDLAGGDEDLLIKGIKQKLFTLDSETVVYPGHGPKTTIAEEKVNNPFLS